MLTVIVGLDGSGKSRTLNPLGSLYSLMPSTSVTLTALVGAGRVATRWPGLRPPFTSTGVTEPVFGGTGCGCAATKDTARARKSARTTRVMGKIRVGNARNRRNCLRGPAGGLSPYLAS